MVSPEMVTLSVFMTPCTNPRLIQWATSSACTPTTASNKCERGGVAGRRVGVVACDRVVDQAAKQVEVAGGAGVLEAADAQVARGDPGEHRSGQHRLALDRTAGRHHGQGSGGRHAERVHRLADDVLAQHRSDCREAVTAASERRPTRPLEVQVASRSVDVDEVAEQQRAAVAEARREATELMAGVDLRHRHRTIGHTVAHQSG